MNKKDIRNVMAEVGCPLAKSTPPTNGGTPKSIRDAGNVIDLKKVLSGYDGSTNWKEWVDFMFAAYNLKTGSSNSKRDLANAVLFAATGCRPKSFVSIYQENKYQPKIAEVLTQMVHTGKLLFNTDTNVTRGIATFRGVPLNIAVRMVYNRMMPPLDWARLKLTYMQNHGIQGSIERRVLVSENAELIELFHETAKEMFNSMHRCPAMRETRMSMVE